MICTKCNINKPITDYYSYFHVVQQKTRTRKVCNDCYNKQKAEYRQKKKMGEIIPEKRIFKPKPVIDYSTNPDYKFCKGCEIYKPRDEFYQQQLKFNSRCRACEAMYQSKIRAERKLLGYDVDTKKPNSYLNEEQRNDVFMVMEAIGWTYNDNGVWSKEGIKDKDKVWTNVYKRGRGPGKKNKLEVRPGKYISYE
ncbi:hypothetical protein UFOVP185_10 [uncultured Caudovirales phage]|uniref:Uncharacterized protein n=1 Tax=uncultured Caudovirales phage TaxID=2100421 RepID=A0A6J7WG10_9CAUD|nr:hypothetical protein UFOVP185_10 [uncultured Caudovirales phage]